MDTTVKKPFNSNKVNGINPFSSSTKCITFVLMILNAFQVLIGVTCCVTCLFVWFDKLYIKRFILTYLSSAVADLRKTFSDSDYNINHVISEYDTTKVLRWMALVFLILTFIILLPALFGISGLCSERHWLLTMYIVATGILVVAKISLTVLCFLRIDIVQNWIRIPLKASLLTSYRGDTATDSISVTWNMAMIGLSCCGVDSGRDFEFSRFDRDFTLTVFNQTLFLTNLQTPIACCNSASRTTMFEPGACAKYPIKEEHTHYFKGCLRKIWNYVTMLSDKLVLATVGLCASEVLQAVLTCVYLELLRRDKADRKRKSSRTYRKGSDFFFPSVSEESLM